MRLPACMHLAGALDAARAASTSLGRIASNFAALEPKLAWTRRPKVDGSQSANFTDAHANAVIVGDIQGKASLRAERGHHLAPRLLSTGRNVFEELGDGFTLLAFDAADRAVATMRQASESLHLPLTIIRDSFKEDRIAYAARLILVRPDQYVVWAADEPPQDGVRLLNQVSGR